MSPRAPAQQQWPRLTRRTGYPRVVFVNGTDGKRAEAARRDDLGWLGEEGQRLEALGGLFDLRQPDQASAREDWIEPVGLFNSLSVARRRYVSGIVGGSFATLATPLGPDGNGTGDPSPSPAANQSLFSPQAEPSVPHSKRLIVTGGWSLMQPPKPHYWFPAKRYSWGWGPPSKWEGWLVLAGYLAVLLALIVLVPADRYPNWFWLGVGTLVTTLIATCWWKGEPPKWRWE